MLLPQYPRMAVTPYISEPSYDRSYVFGGPSAAERFSQIFGPRNEFSDLSDEPPPPGPSGALLSDFADLPQTTLDLTPQTPLMSRRRTDALTGGTGDVNPEYVTFSFQVPAGTSQNTLVQRTFTFPIQQFYGTNQNIVPIVELLATSCNFQPVTIAEQVRAGTTTSYLDIRCSMGGSDNPGTADIANAPSQRTFVEYTINGGSNNASPSGLYASESVIGGGSPHQNTNSNSFAIDHIDQNGHGILLYGNTITCSVLFHRSGQSWTDTTQLVFYFYYRVKNVNLTQYLAGQAALGGTLSVN